MSYSFKIVVKNGKPHVDSKSLGIAVPDGEFTVSGHEDEAGRSISIHRSEQRKIEDGRPYWAGVAQASGWAARG